MSCMFGELQRRKWRRKTFTSSIRKHSHNKPGKWVSTDQLVSMQPGLVPRISDRHTRERNTAVTCFMDHKSDFGYIHLCTTTSQEKTLAGKVAFEKLAESHGVKVVAYYADNGRFAKLGFRELVASANQTIIFCGVDAHH